MSEKIRIFYTGIGYGRPGCAQSLQSWGGDNVTPVDVLSHPAARESKAAIYKAGYHILSKVPHGVYRIARNFVDNGGANGILDIEQFRADFEGTAAPLVAVTPLASAILSEARLPHSVVNCDHFLKQKHLTPYVENLFVPGMEILDGIDVPAHIRVVDVGGVLWPKEYENIDFDKRRKGLGKDGVPTIGVVTHGAGEMESVATLPALLPALRARKIHAAFFVGTHGWMGKFLRSIATARDISVVKNFNVPVRAGSISIWEAPTTIKALAVRTSLLTSDNYHLSVLPTANENCDNGAGLVGGARSVIEQNTFASAEKGGWVDHRGRVSALSQTLRNVLEVRGGSSKAQRMTDRAKENIVFDAGRKVIATLQRG